MSKKNKKNKWKPNCFSFRMPSGNVYTIQIVLARFGLMGAGYYRLKVLEAPICSYSLGVSAHLLDENFICVSQGREPTTIDRAKAVAFAWMAGFEIYRQTGEFPNGRFRFDVK